jgi:nicotinamidase-related amidase
MPDNSKTAVILVDPYNDFLHPEGKANGLLADSLAHSETIKHLKEVVNAARAAHIPIYYGLHQQYKPGFISGWTHPTSLQAGQSDSHAFEQGTWGAEIYKGLEPDLANNDVVFSQHWTSS